MALEILMSSSDMLERSAAQLKDSQRNALASEERRCA